MDEAKTIDDVIDRLGEVVAESRRSASRLGYFAALYRKVTIRVREAIAADFFDDGPRMEALDVRFANRYLAAENAHRDGLPVMRCWQVAFDATEAWWPIVLQHLLLGMNAHINLDLGVAAARTVGRDQLEGLHPDFDRINWLLSELVGGVQAELEEIWPLLRVFSGTIGSVQGAVINFSMERARDEAWEVATRLAAHSLESQEAEIARLDTQVAWLAGRIRHPGFVAGTALRAVRIGERGPIPRKIEILM